MNEIIVIGKCFKSQNTGPANVIRGLCEGYEKLGEDVKFLLLNEELSSLKFTLKLAKLILFKKNCAINVHTDGLKIPWLVYKLSRLNRKNTYYLTVHGIYSIESQMAGNTQKKYLKKEAKLFKKFDNLVCVSQMLKDRIGEKYGRDKNVFVIPNATDAANFGLKREFVPHDGINAVSLGGIKNRKGIWELLDVTEYLSKRKNLPFKCTVYGGCDSSAALQKFREETARRGLEENIIYGGDIAEKRRVYEILCGADVQFCLSKFDTFNIAIAESIALGCPCVCTDDCGAAYLIYDGVNGISINFSKGGAEQKIFEFITTRCDNRAAFDEITALAEEMSQRLSWPSVCREYLALFK